MHAPLLRLFQDKKKKKIFFLFRRSKSTQEELSNLPRCSSKNRISSTHLLDHCFGLWVIWGSCIPCVAPSGGLSSVTEANYQSSLISFFFTFFFFYCCCKSIARCKLDLIWSFSSPFSNIFLRNKTGGIFGKHRHTIGIESSRRQIAVQHQLICFPVCELSRSRVMMIIFSKYGCLQPLMQRAKDIKVIVQVFWCGVVCGTYC